MAEDEAEQEAQLIEGLTDLITRQYRPAKGAGEATDMLSTEQICAILEEHSPELIPRHLLRDALEGLGFRTHRVGSTIYWLLAPAQG